MHSFTASVTQECLIDLRPAVMGGSVSSSEKSGNSVRFAESRTLQKTFSRIYALYVRAYHRLLKSCWLHVICCLIMFTCVRIFVLWIRNNATSFLSTHKNFITQWCDVSFNRICRNLSAYKPVINIPITAINRETSHEPVGNTSNWTDNELRRDVTSATCAWLGEKSNEPWCAMM